MVVVVCQCRRGRVVVVVAVTVVVVASSWQAQGARGGVANLSMPATRHRGGVVIVVVLGGWGWG
jgi:hypothetical protein